MMSQTLRSHPKPAIVNVFTLPELLESILWHIPAIDLIVVQRVHSQWRNIIAQPRFQSKLFLTSEARENDKLGDQIRWNPIFELAGGTVDGDNLHLRCNDFAARFLQRMPGRRKRWRARSGCWREMHITQPSSTSITVHRKDIKAGYGGSVHRLEQSTGVTIEHLSRIVNEVLTPSSGNLQDDQYAIYPKDRRLEVSV